MKISITAKILLFALLLGILCSSFIVYTLLVFQDKFLTQIFILFCIIIISVFAGFAFILKQHMHSILSQLSEVISSLTNLREQEVFSVLNDDMLSKLQTQVLKLSGILKANNARLKKERDEIQSLISDISHQLKTPLANLHVYHDLLKDPSITPKQREEFTQNIQNQLQKLSFLLESLIKMSRLESGIIQLNPQVKSLKETCMVATEQVLQKAQSKEIKICLPLAQDIRLAHDSNWTAEAIFNILDNAVKYTPKGGTVTSTYTKYELFARLDISDTGGGLDEDEVNHIFKRFYRGENARQQEGVGIGLYLAREIMVRQGGYIKVHSKKGEGSIFSLFLPLNQD